MWGFFKNIKDEERAITGELPQCNPQTFQRQGLSAVIAHLFTLSMLFGFGCYLKHEIAPIQTLSQVSITREADILSQLNDLKSELAVTQANQQQIGALKADLIHLQQSVATEQSLDNLIKNVDLKKITDQLTQLKKTLHFGATPMCPILKNHVARRAANFSRVLPFKVESLDRMAGQSFASVIYRQDRIPVLLNDSVAGWKAVQMEVSAGAVVWENAEHHRVKVSISREQYV